MRKRYALHMEDASQPVSQSSDIENVSHLADTVETTKDEPTEGKKETWTLVRASNGRIISLNASGLPRYQGTGEPQRLDHARNVFHHNALRRLNALEKTLVREMREVDKSDEPPSKRATARCKIAAELRAIIAERRDVLGIGKPKPADSIQDSHVAKRHQRGPVYDVEPLGYAGDVGELVEGSGDSGQV